MSNPSYFDAIRGYPLCRVDFRRGRASRRVGLLDLDGERGFPLLSVLNGRISMWQGVEPLVASLH